MTSLTKIEGIGAANTRKLQEAGIKSIEALLEQGATKKGRNTLEKSTGISGANLLKWVNRADLMRVKGIGEEYADLLEAAGVDTVPELGKRKPDNLHAKMTEVNTAKKLVRQLPSAKVVAGWVEQAKSMERVVKY